MWKVFILIINSLTQSINLQRLFVATLMQGIKPPNTRNTDQFDAGAKYHVASDVGYVRYFTAFIYEFQFYRELCLASGFKRYICHERLIYELTSRKEYKKGKYIYQFLN